MNSPHHIHSPFDFPRQHPCSLEQKRSSSLITSQTAALQRNHFQATVTRLSSSISGESQPRETSFEENLALGAALLFAKTILKNHPLAVISPWIHGFCSYRQNHVEVSQGSDCLLFFLQYIKLHVTSSKLRWGNHRQIAARLLTGLFSQSLPAISCMFSVWSLKLKSTLQRLLRL